MAYDAGTAQRVREYFNDHPHAHEKKMFGGVGFMLSGNMCVGVLEDGIVVRVGPPNYQQALQEPFAREFDFTGRPMKGWVVVTSEGLAEDVDLHTWIARGEAFAGALEPK
ncbi:MAG TPA: RNA methyltransferase [Oceanospirillaceae bacterium]|nr:RNA methyltransferase [Oceanospirillaceae bacterium]